MRVSASTVLPLLIGLLLSGAACSGSANKAAQGPKTPGGDSKHAGENTHTGAKGEVGFVEGGDKACMLHQQAGAYFSCLTGSDGQCFHFGTTCTPRSNCMFDAKSGQHKLCEESDNGSCLRFAASCEPEAGCMYDPGDNLYRQCSKYKDGACLSFGPACQPAP